MTEKPRAVEPDSTGSAPGGSAPAGPATNPAGERIVIRDKRKVSLTDEQGQATGSASAPADAESTAESTADSTAESAAVTDPGSAADGPADGPPAADPADDLADGQAAADLADDLPAADSADDLPTANVPAGGGASALVVDDVELVEVLEAKTPTGTDAPVVDAPAKPVSGAGAPVSGAPVDTSGPLGAELEALRAELDERTGDLQRVSAEYANYRKRVDRDRGVVAEQTTGAVLTALLPVLDDLDRAREHGDLVGPFGAVAEQLTTALGKFGLTVFGEQGDAFDPTRHEAVAHLTSAKVTEPTCVEVMRRGYLLNDRLLRAALVAVADPE